MLDIFLNRKRKRRGLPKDEFDLLIDDIEKFAPDKYQSEREIHYYNYKMIPQYVRPLKSLLSHISKRMTVEINRKALIVEMFLKLKDFYDARQTLTLKEAYMDLSLKIKLIDLLKYFFDLKDISLTDLEEWLSEFDKT